MHLFIMWGFLGLFLGTVLLSIDHYLVHFLYGVVYLYYSVILEIFGLLLLLGLIWALIRRYVQRLPRLENRKEDLGLLIWLLVVIISGFYVEALRLAFQQPAWTLWSFAGLGLSFLCPSTMNIPATYPYFWWFHALLSLGLIAIIPYSKLFHMMAAPVNIYFKDHPENGIDEACDSQNVEYSVKNLINFDACTRCGRCVEVCPAASVGEPLSPRDFILDTREHLFRKYKPFFRLPLFREQTNNNNLDDEVEGLWHCTTCN
ncbi:respiratory nitrate reductase subunit gamma, partial [candidate division CSSED10-310 bacterium]